MEKIFVSHSVGPSKLDLLLAEAPQLTDIGREKVCLIIDIAKCRKLLGQKALTGRQFTILYDSTRMELQQWLGNLELAVEQHRIREELARLGGVL